MYAWAKDAPPAEMPENVGFEVGNEYEYVVLQVHYAHPLDAPDNAGVTISYSNNQWVQPNIVHMASFFRLKPKEYQI